MECKDVGVDDTFVRSSSSGRECRERREPNRLEGRPCFWRLRGRDLVMSLSMLLLESVLLMGVRGLDGAISVVEPGEKRVAERVLWSRPPNGALFGGEVKAERGGGRRILFKDFRGCLSDMVIMSNEHWLPTSSCSLLGKWLA